MSRFSHLFPQWRKEDRDLAIIRLQKRIILGLLAILGITYLGWMSAPSRLTFYVPPDLSQGVTQAANRIPPSFVYSFAYSVWQQLNTWPSDGSQEYRKAIQTYWSYLTPSFTAELLEDSDELKATGQSERQRFLEGIPGEFSPTSVKRLSRDTWEVDVEMHLMEFRNHQPVKDAEILYPLKVTRFAISPKDNPYGLALSGFAAPPVRLKTTI